MDLSSSFGFYSPDYYSPVSGGSLFPTAETSIQAPQTDASLNPIPDYASESWGAVYAQDGATGDSSDVSGLWSNFAGIAGTFLRAFTGGRGVTLGATTTNTPKPVATAPSSNAATNQMVLIGAGLVLVLILVIAVRK